MRGMHARRTQCSVQTKQSSSPAPLRRRSFLKRLGWGGTLLASATGWLTGRSSARAGSNGGLNKGDAAILRFLAAAEILETDAWQQYNELGGTQDSEVPGGTGNTAYTTALEVLDSDMAQYVHDNTEDEFTHFDFINAYLTAHGMAPADLDKFRTLSSSTATGAQQIRRLTNLCLHWPCRKRKNLCLALATAFVR